MPRSSVLWNQGTQLLGFATFLMCSVTAIGSFIERIETAEMLRWIQNCKLDESDLNLELNNFKQFLQVFSLLSIYIGIVIE